MAIIPRSQIAQTGAGNFGNDTRGIADPDVAAQIAGQTKIAQIGADASKYAPSLQQERFSQIFPWLVSQQGQNAPYNPGPSPTVRVGPVYNPQQLQTQVNASNANIDRSTATQQQQNASQMGGRGFGGNSPMLAALQGQTAQSGLGQRTQASQQLRTTAAQQNAQNILATQTASGNQYAQRQAEQLQARGQDVQRSQSLIAALAGIA